MLGLFYFTRGFLLTKLILEDQSACDEIPSEAWSGPRVANTEPGCWYPRKFSKAVIVVIDALRYDFTVPFASQADVSGPHHYHDAFPILHEYALSRPENAFLLPFIADPPTTTLQRLKGLTTGTLPTFIDAGTNFAGTAIEEDNLLIQLRRQGKRLVHLGDDTWQSLFPGFFDVNLSRPYDSFNVWDLHTVDDGVLAHLFPLLQSSDTSWDVLVGHLLGVDHAGHRYGPNHLAMRQKLLQMDDAVRRMTEQLDDDTLLVVLGDHGMDSKGDHGGESDDEVEAALWMYSSRPIFGRTQSDFRIPPATAKVRPVRQTDLVSTLSLLLGLPIPFNNIGAPIEEAFSGREGADWRALTAVNDITLSQIRSYQRRYAEARNLPSEAAEKNESDLQKLQLSQLLEPTLRANADQLTAAYRTLRKHEEAVMQSYRRLWADFNLVDMSLGIVVLVGGVVGLQAVTSYRSPLSYQWLRKIKIIGAAAGLFAGLLDWLLSGRIRLMTALLGTVCGALLTFSLAAEREHRKRARLWPNSIWSWFALFATVSQAGGFASNSYTIHEDTILLFFLSSFGVLCCTSSMRQYVASERSRGFASSCLFVFLSRLASGSRLCREEQMPGCRSTFYASSNSSTSAPWQVFLPFAVALLLPVVIEAFYLGIHRGDRRVALVVDLWFRIGLVLVAIYWTLDAADNGNWLHGLLSPQYVKSLSLTVSRCVIGIATLLGTLSTGWIPYPTKSLPLFPPDSLDRATKAGQQTDNKHKSTFCASQYILNLSSICLLILLVLPPMGQFSAAICIAQILCLVEMLHANVLTTGSGMETSADRYGGHPIHTSAGPCMLAVLGSYHFFKTGHQATLASIQWNAAFVPLRTIVYPWSPFLVVINTFGAQILCALAVPLIVLRRRSGSMNDTLRAPADDQDQDVESSIKMNKGSKPPPPPPLLRSNESVIQDVLKGLMVHVSYYATIQLATTLWAGHLRRHLMLYRVFMPRFLMASVLVVVLDLIVLLGFLMTLRSTASSSSVGNSQ